MEMAELESRGRTWTCLHLDHFGPDGKGTVQADYRVWRVAAAKCDQDKLHLARAVSPPSLSSLTLSTDPIESSRQGAKTFQLPFAHVALLLIKVVNR